MNPNENKMTDVANKVYATRQSSDVFSSLQTSSHVHNGVDSPRINQKDLALGTKFQLQCQLIPGGTTDFFTLSGVSNPTSMTFYGFAANNAGGGGATKKATVNGRADFGPCTISLSTSLSGGANFPVDFIQCSSATYFDTSALNKTTVLISGLNLVYVADEAGTLRASITVTSFDNQSITMTGFVDTGWQIQGNFFIS